MSRRVIVVTGGAGFIGSNIVARLTAEDNYDVVVCDRLETAASGKWRNLAKHNIADLWGPEELFDQLEGVADRVSAIVHMGAISSTTEEDADLIARTNFSLSRDLWAWAAERRSRLIYASSAATYGDGAQGFVDDDAPGALNALRPLNAYGWSKALFDRYAVREAARGHAPRQWAGLKFFNVYGPNEGHKGGMKSVVAQIWPKVAAGEPVTAVPLAQSRGLRGRRSAARLRLSSTTWSTSSPGCWGRGTSQRRVQRRLGPRAVSFADLATATFAAAGRDAGGSSTSTCRRSIGEKYQYFTEARTWSRVRAAGYERPVDAAGGGRAPLRAGLPDAGRIAYR
jgi:ADP-L-glycero-D-manno-heptose 6-epimerase